MNKKICFTGGGTAGHVFPGLSVIEALCGKYGYSKADFIWIGSSGGMERNLIQDAGIEFRGISSGKLRRYLSFKNITDIFKIAVGFIQAFFILLKVHPQIIFSKGGYVSVPPVVAGWLLGVPVLTHESDFTPGLATKINAMFSKKVLLSLEETRKYIKPKYRGKCVVVGNPVRAKFRRASAESGLKFLGFDNKKPLVFAVGGSQGSGEINRLIYEIRGALAEKYYVAHQTGANQAIDGPDLRGYVQIPFIKSEMADVIAASSVVITRAGAGSLWELAAAGKAAVLIPLRGSGTRGDQVKNAEYFKAHGAASVLTGKSIDSKALLKEVDEILSTEKGALLAGRIKKLDIENSAELIADEITKNIKRSDR